MLLARSLCAQATLYLLICVSAMSLKRQLIELCPWRCSVVGMKIVEEKAMGAFARMEEIKKIRVSGHNLQEQIRTHLYILHRAYLAIVRWIDRNSS
jgi:hypothetical protein